MDVLKWAITFLTVLGLSNHFIEFFCQVWWWFPLPFVRNTVIVHILGRNVLRYLIHLYHVFLATLLKKRSLSDLDRDIFGYFNIRCLQLSTWGLLVAAFAISWEVNLAIRQEIWVSEKVTFNVFIQITLLSEC